MFRIVTTLIACCIALCAALYESNDGRRDRSTLLSLDVDESFLQDPEFQTLKSNFAFYKQEAFLRILSDAYIYQPLIKQKIAEAGLPPALVYMAMAESSFKPKAYSTAKAMGIWQFVAGTAKRYGLKVDNYADERRDPIKSTDAAIRYLKDLHAQFGKWSLAIMAYNCGEGRLKRAITQAGTDNLEVLMSVNPRTNKAYLPYETRNYLRKVLALASLAESESLMTGAGVEHLLNRGSSYPMAVVEVAPGATFQEIARASGASVASIRALNPALRYEFAPPQGKSYSIYLPYDKIAEFKQNYEFAANDNRYVVHIVQKGDNLSAIAHRYGVTTDMVKDFNRLTSSTIKEKQQLIIPMIRQSVAAASAPSEYVVQKGDSLDSIARKFKISVAELKDANRLVQNTIYAGERLIIIAR
ncbi:MAG: transglycosylase SLT domain-containing protein [Helicobacteraceae bacterium]|jgi:membrane-bound lytic murein transglycosylase D|nr:transglycosylase SLT domain-containing protein [Helicobacteraceae bacterium]